MPANKKTLIERMNDGVKKNIRDNVNDITAVQFPSKAVKKTPANERLWEDLKSYYRVETSSIASYEMRSVIPLICFKYISDEVGCGIFANRTIGASVILPVHVYLGKLRKHGEVDEMSAFELQKRNLREINKFL